MRYCKMLSIDVLSRHKISLISNLLFLVLSAFHSGNATAEGLSHYIENERNCFEDPSGDGVDKRAKKVNETIVCKKFDYLVDGIRVDGFYAYSQVHDERIPAIIFNRGGNGSFGAIGKEELESILLPFANRGYFIIATQYRGLDKGDFALDEFGGKDVNDVLFLLNIIDDVKFVDNKRIGIFGTSRGAMMSLLANKFSNRFGATAIISPPTDLINELKTKYGQEMEKNVFIKKIPAYKKNKVSELKNRSATYWVDKLEKKSPILVIHSIDDDRISPLNTLRFVEKLHTSHIQYKLVMFESGEHSLKGHRNEMLNAVNDWFSKFLK
ncbi:MAG: hypothetical protein EOO53_14265 [Gammaproteobacteria bacterium]|nr:MAG: hypothetical protein EOO53_14265 [Gammaproteobacteria bacterium]